MKNRSTLGLSIVLVVVLGGGPLLSLASPVSRSPLKYSSNAGRKSESARVPFSSRFLSRRPAQNANDIPPGQTTTVLPDGSQLKIGGLDQDGPVASIVIEGSRAASSGSAVHLQRARAWHTATMLPDGTVLIVGGIGANGQVVEEAEIFNPETQTAELLNPPQSSILNPRSSSVLTPRVYHTATLLTEGLVLIAGGLSSKGDIVKAAELWDFRSRAASRLQAKLKTARYNHTAKLLADGKVLLSGGSNKNGNAVEQDEVFDPIRERFIKANPENSVDSQFSFLHPQLVASLPEDGASNVPLDAFVALRFSKPLRVDTVNGNALTLNGPYGRVEAKVVAAEAGTLGFITPKSPLFPGSTYTVSVSGSTDFENRAIADAAISFTTAAGRMPIDVSDDEEWIPDVTGGPNWQTGRAASPWQSLPPLQAPPGVTALAGQVLTLNGRPLSSVILKIDDASAQTDDTGRFLLTYLKRGHHELLMDGRTASHGAKTYGVFEAGLEIKDGETNVLPYTIWMPKLDSSHTVTITSPTAEEVVITTPRIPGLEVHIPPHAVVYDEDYKPVTQLSITPIPVDRPPFPLPVGVQVPVYFTVQPGGAYVKIWGDGPVKGARIIYPNYTYQPPGARADFWHYDPEERGWYVYGQGTVNNEGTQTVPDPGVSIYKFTGAMVGFNSSAPAEGPPPGGDSSDGDPVDLYTGLFVLKNTDLILPDVLPIAVSRTYRPRDTVSRAFGIGCTLPYNMFLVGDSLSFTYAELILPDGGRIRFNRISPGNSYGDAVMEHTATPTAFYKARLTWNGAGWDLTFKDGTVYVLGDRSAPVQSIRDRYGNQIMITRSSFQQGNITKITSPNGRWMEFSYDASNRITQVRDLIGRAVNYTYDASGRLWKVTDAIGGVTEYTYDSSHRMLTLKDARGTVYLTNQYDANGRVSLQTQADSTTYQFAYTLDGNGKVTQTDVTDTRGNTRRVAFNSSGYATTETYALGRPEQQAYTFAWQSGTNLPLSVTDQLGRTTSYVYDSMGNVTSVTQLAGSPDAITTSFTYEPVFNQLASVTDPLNHTTQVAYDSKGNLISATDPLSNQATFTYNSAGQPTSATNPLGKTIQFGYDGGDLISVTNPLNQTVNRFVDSAGRLLSVTNPLGQTVKLEYDLLNRQTRVTDPLQGATAYAYDPNGNLLSVTDARNNAISYAYDNMDRVQTRTDPLLRNTSYLYDNNGNLRQLTDRKSQVTSYTYDSLNRLTLVTYADNSTTSYTYDGGNRLTQVIDSISGTITYTYDNLDRVTSEATPQGTVSYTYDAAGRRATMAVPGQSTVSFTYDSADRLTQIAQGTSSVGFTYDAASRVTTQTLPNGVVTEYGYDDASRLTSLTYKKGANVLGNLAYSYDSAGHRTVIGGSLASTGLPPTLTTTSYNSANQQTGFGGQTLTFDNNGNLTSDGTNTYTWNARNQLASMSGPGLTASFQYDAVGRRISKTINGTTTGFLYDGVNIVQEQSGGSASANTLTGGVDQLFSRTDSSGTVSSLADALGSIIALTDSNGAIQTQYSYEPFGKTTATGAASGNPSKYTGREDDGTGLYYYRARYYSPSLQRFISEDPIGLNGGVNLYDYGRSDPVDHNDPLGLKPHGGFPGSPDGTYGDDSHFGGWRGGWPPRRAPWDKGGPRWYEADKGGEPEPPGPASPPAPDGQGGGHPRVGPPENLEDAYRNVRPPETYNPGNPSKPSLPYPRTGSWWDKTLWWGSKGADLLKGILEHFGQGATDFIIILTPPDVIEDELYRQRTGSPRMRADASPQDVLTPSNQHMREVSERGATTELSKD